MARTIREVLAGQRDLADLERDGEVMGLVRSGVRQYEDVAAMSLEERERLYAEAREIAEQDERDTSA